MKKILFLFLSLFALLITIFSWGESWGEGGYMYLARDAGNLCGISSFAQGATC